MDEYYMDLPFCPEPTPAPTFSPPPVMPVKTVRHSCIRKYACFPMDYILTTPLFLCCVFRRVKERATTTSTRAERWAAER